MEKEITVTTKPSVWCEGEGASGHPRVYLHIESETGEIMCPYCSRAWKLERAGHAGH